MPSSAKHIIVIGHRGATGLEPENTMRSFRKALQLGVDTIECDVHLTQDRQVVLMHDHTVDRTTNGSGFVNGLTFDEIRRLDAGKGEQVPTLQELLDLAKGKLELHIELKDPTAVEAVLDLVKQSGMEDAVFLTTGDTDVLKRVRSLHPTISLEHIFGDPPDDAIDRALSVGAKRISCHFRKLTQAYVDQGHTRGLHVIAWPPNTREEQECALDFGVDLICSDRPDVLIDTLRALGLR